MYLCVMTVTHEGSLQVVLSAWMTVSLVGGALVLWHAVRAARTDEAGVRAWMRVRGLGALPRHVDEVGGHLRSIRWSRAAATAVALAVSLAVLALAGTSTGVATLPVLVASLFGQLVTEPPRRPRHRVAALGRREPGYFAPRAAVLAARALLLGGVALTAAGLVQPMSSAYRTQALVHLASCVVGLVAFELALRAISLRALPQASDDLAVACALRVADSRAAAAAGLLFGAFGTLMGLGFGVRADLAGPLGYAVNQLVTLGMVAALVGAAVVASPQTSWRPRGTT